MQGHVKTSAQCISCAPLMKHLASLIYFMLKYVQMNMGALPRRCRSFSLNGNHPSRVSRAVQNTTPECECHFSFSSRETGFSSRLLVVGPAPCQKTTPDCDCLFPLLLTSGNVGLGARSEGAPPPDRDCPGQRAPETPPASARSAPHPCPETPQRGCHGPPPFGDRVPLVSATC